MTQRRWSDPESPTAYRDDADPYEDWYRVPQRGGSRLDADDAGGWEDSRDVPARRWGMMPGRLGVCVVIGSAALGALISALTNQEPGAVLGVFLIFGSVAGSLVVRPRTGYLILPVPALAYLVAAFITGLAASQFSFIDLAPARDLPRIGQLISQYANLPLGTSFDLAPVDTMLRRWWGYSGDPGQPARRHRTRPDRPGPRRRHLRLARPRPIRRPTRRPAATRRPRIEQLLDGPTAPPTPTTPPATNGSPPTATAPASSSTPSN